MKKTAAVLACVLLAAHDFAKDDYSRQISECIAALGKAVPDGYERTGRTEYRKIGENIALTIGEDKKLRQVRLEPYLIEQTKLLSGLDSFILFLKKKTGNIMIPKSTAIYIKKETSMR
jgi:hypothetical protein